LQLINIIIIIIILFNEINFLSCSVASGFCS